MPWHRLYWVAPVISARTSLLCKMLCNSPSELADDDDLAVTQYPAMVPGRIRSPLQGSLGPGTVSAGPSTAEAVPSGTPLPGVLSPTHSSHSWRIAHVYASSLVSSICFFFLHHRTPPPSPTSLA